MALKLAESQQNSPPAHFCFKLASLELLLETQASVSRLTYRYNSVTRRLRSLQPPSCRRNDSWLRAYFSSGWAFFIPYLFFYLLYAWQRWPVNPAQSGAGGEETGSRVTIIMHGPPSLLYVYWALHMVNFVIGILALRSWWQGRSAHPTNGASTSSFEFSISRSLLPWLCLALIFWIPGIYLEWPSDPWEHLRRINEWHILSHVTAHSSWRKSSYFLPYSLTSHTTGLVQLHCLNLYYIGICLLLSWQYYRLARAVGLGERMSFLFVLLNALTFGNSVFSFYRYYGLSSSIFAQIGAVALTRIAVEYFSRPRSTSKTTEFEAAGINRLSNFYPLPFTHYPLLRSGVATLALLPLIAFNHVQGLGIAGLGVLAVVVWRLIEWKRSMIGWLALVAIVLSAATVLWFPRNPALDEVYRHQGWLTAWYGFNLFSPSSPAFDRSLQILGIFGVLNLILGLWLIVRCNHIAGWLTLVPVLALALPCVALPFAQAVAANISTADIIIFHRMLLAVPMGLALFAIFGHKLPARAFICRSPASGCLRQAPASIGPSNGSSLPGALLVSCSLLLGVVLYPGPSSYNRFWHAVAITPDDLQFKLSTGSAAQILNITQIGIEKKVLSTTGTAFCLAQFGARMVPFQRRISSRAGAAAIADEQSKIHDYLRAVANNREVLVIGLDTGSFFSPASQAGLLSSHWLPVEAALNLAGMPELHADATALKFSERHSSRAVWLMINFPLATPQL